MPAKRTKAEKRNKIESTTKGGVTRVTGKGPPLTKREILLKHLGGPDLFTVEDQRPKR
jgi:hypothetical protein